MILAAAQKFKRIASSFACVDNINIPPARSGIQQGAYLGGNPLLWGGSPASPHLRSAEEKYPCSVPKRVLSQIRLYVRSGIHYVIHSQSTGIVSDDHDVLVFRNRWYLQKSNQFHRRITHPSCIRRIIKGKAREEQNAQLLRKRGVIKVSRCAPRSWSLIPIAVGPKIVIKAAVDKKDKN